MDGMKAEVERLFKKGVAVGRSDVYYDTVQFWFKEESWSFPTSSTVGIATYNGRFYTAKVDKLRDLAEKMDQITKELHNGRD